MPLLPLEDRVIIEPDAAPEQIGEIYVPDTSKDRLRPAQGTIIAIGPGLNNDPMLTKILWTLIAACKHFDIPIPDRVEPPRVDFKPGDRVLHGKYAGVSHEYEGKEVLIMRMTDLIAKI